MSETLERVIADQQAQIDALKAQVDKLNKEIEQNNISWTDEQESTDRLISLVLRLCDDTRNLELRRAVRGIIGDKGYCLACHQLICECGE